MAIIPRLIFTENLLLARGHITFKIGEEQAKSRTALSKQVTKGPIKPFPLLGPYFGHVPHAKRQSAANGVFLELRALGLFIS